MIDRLSGVWIWESRSSSTATVSITVTPVNDPPQASADTAVTAEDTPVSGSGGGVGVRSGGLPIIVYATDNIMRHRESGDGTPGGCPMDASFDDIAEAAEATGAILVAFDVSGGGTPRDGMLELANLTGSIGDLDGDGVAAEALVFDLPQSSDASFNTQFKNQLIQAIEYTLSVPYDIVDVLAEGDVGFVVQTVPDQYTQVVTGEELSFDILLEGVLEPGDDDQVIKIDFQILGDGVVDLGNEVLIIVVPRAE